VPSASVMPWDLAWGALLIGGLAAAAFCCFYYLSARLSSLVSRLLAAVIVATLVYYVFEIWYDVRVARWLPASNLILIGNWLPVLAAALAALVWRETEIHQLRRSLWAGGLAMAAGFSFLYPLLGATPRCQDRWDKLGTCLQTTPETCSPAAAATLLRHYGVEATEQEMAQLCLTRNGTSWQGLFRGLKLKTADTPYDVEVVRCTADGLPDLADRPLILSVGLSRGSRADSDFTREFGWQPGVNHSVVLLRFDANSNALIADPSLEMCREYWSPEMLKTLWRGYAFRLVERAQRDSDG
jgi:hypothetical protein